MKGESLRTAKSAVRDMMAVLKQWHVPTEMPIISTIIAFERVSLQLSPVMPVDRLDLECLRIESIQGGGVAFFDSALACVEASFNRELVRPGEKYGDARPVVVWLTACRCGDSNDAGRLSRGAGVKHIVVLAAGHDAEDAKRLLGGDAACIRMGNDYLLDSLKYELDPERGKLKEGWQPIFYPKGYDTTLHMVPW